ncbi:group II intron reverse transcriptase/maturase [Pseudomonas canadensis]|uniref:RNA-directed DNA polymerase n=1 Tax=Pseudomonas canadensis TaxID=915099 RepID=A0A423FE19_9PSED|nr:group II intron reverse transcriptase/maturase [Pseudomonas canadensis]
MKSPISDEVDCPQDEPDSAGQGLLERAFARENLKRAWKRVKANKGAAGVDGLGIEQTGEQLLSRWPTIREQLISGVYRPSPVRHVVIPKPDGGERELGIPTVTDRLIQQALLQVLQPLIDPSFSEHSYGFRPGRCAQDAVLAAQRRVSSGRKVVVDVDLEKFFDRVDHDILIDRLRKRIPDPAVIRLIRAYLDAGTQVNGVVEKRRRGTPQGGPLSPLLANVLLDEVDRELERRGHCFVRYADDANVYVRSKKAGQRVMALLKRLYGKLHLSVNESKSAVASVFGRKFLGYAFWSSANGIKRKVASKAREQFKQRIRRLTRRSGGQSLQQVVDRLRPYILGWKAYFGLSQTPKVWRELCRLGARESIACKVAANSRCWWRNSRLELNRVLDIAWFDRMGLARLS